jgi:electron transfer flavoprotein alpha/beta subunit
VKRLYIVVRNDITPGLQIAQACHAAREFTLYADEDVGDNLVVLQAGPAELAQHVERALAYGCAVVRFHEPDLGGELTAAAFGGGAQRILASLPLALRK